MFSKDSKLRATAITLLMIFGLITVYGGWHLTGKILGLLLMFLGVAFLLAALFVYNAPYFVKKD